jgi:thiol:disulfide interchange protein DsbC
MRLAMKQIFSAIFMTIFMTAFSLAEEAGNVGVRVDGADNSKVDTGRLENIAARIESRLRQARPTISVSRVEPTPVPGLFRVTIAGGESLYATEDGSHVVAGKIYRADPGLFVDVEDERIKPLRAEVLGQIPAKEMIVFSPDAGTELRASIYVFTDADCGYCQKLHSHMDEYNKLGIEVKYLAFPRAGVSSPSGEKLVSAWCADDTRQAMTALKQRKPIPKAVCDNPVEQQFALGRQIGVNGTPAIFTHDGSAIPGYRPPDALARDLGL